MKRNLVSVVGLGPGDAKFLTAQARHALQEADVLCGYTVYIDLVRPLRDGVIQDHRMTNELIVRFVNEVCRSRIFKPRIAVCVPAQITGVEADAVVESVMGAGAKQVFTSLLAMADEQLQPQLAQAGERSTLSPMLA